MNKKNKVKKKLGRPRIVDNTNTYKAPKYPEVAPTKFLGYCKCNGMIVKKDLVSIRVYVCPACGKRAGLNKLKKSLESKEPKHTSKREYLNDTLHVNFADHANGDGGAHDVVKNVKIAE